jgi:hypothetical protein
MLSKPAIALRFLLAVLLVSIIADSWSHPNLAPGWLESTLQSWQSKQE